MVGHFQDVRPQTIAVAGDEVALGVGFYVSGEQERNLAIGEAQYQAPVVGGPSDAGGLLAVVRGQHLQHHAVAQRNPMAGVKGQCRAFSVCYYGLPLGIQRAIRGDCSLQYDVGAVTVQHAEQTANVVSVQVGCRHHIQGAVGGWDQRADGGQGSLSESAPPSTSS